MKGAPSFHKPSDSSGLYQLHCWGSCRLFARWDNYLFDMIRGENIHFVQVRRTLFIRMECHAQPRFLTIWTRLAFLRLLTWYLFSLSQVDFAVNYTRVTFDGTLGGEEDEYERNMMGSCYQVISEETMEHKINNGPQHLIRKMYFMTQCSSVA